MAPQFLYAVPKPNETTPTVLVVGATGETGRQVVRKLVLKGKPSILSYAYVCRVEHACLPRLYDRAFALFVKTLSDCMGGRPTQGDARCGAHNGILSWCM